MNVIIDYRASQATFDALLKMGFNIIKTPEIDFVYDAISGHPDIMLHKISANEVVCEPRVYDYFHLKLPEMKITKGASFLKAIYPYDIAYNVCSVSNKIFCNIPNTEKEILKRYDEMGFDIIHVNQGYTKCSICVVSDNAIITADKGICKAAEKNRIDVLMVDDKDIKLKGFEHGFIGGATGLISKNKLAVNGNIERHREYIKIINFCKKYNVEVISLNDGEITDLGSIIAM